MDLLTQLNRAMEYIEATISDEEALSSVADVTCYSPYHFQRIFNYITGMPLSEYIRRRKMSLAAMELQGGSDKIIDVAVKYGYDSADSFTRAFVKQHGITPTAARKSGTSFEIYPPLTFQIQIKGVQKMNWRIEEKEAFDVFGIEGMFENDGETNLIPGFWDKCCADGSQQRLAAAAGNHRDVAIAICGACEKGTNIFRI
ncbi:MAG: AraC family transcriptional regulator [Clostridiaceae bacterium]|nr:AraC family transcriptional regulator [Clostridiaceae bacterium]